MSNKFLSRIKHYITAHQLITPSAKYLIGLSGGADSVALLLALQQLGFKDVEAVHCNFLLRGEESNRDEDFCKSLCHRLNIPLHTVHFATTEFAQLRKLSIEMAARTLRYDYFEKLRVDIGCAGICVAHHKNDSVETMLLNLCRGTGVQGLSGIKPRNGNIIRPFLCVERGEILEYLHTQGEGFVTDSTNLHDEFARNHIRLHVLPQLSKVNPAVINNMDKTANYIDETGRFVNYIIAQQYLPQIERLGKNIRKIPFSMFHAVPSSSFLLWHLLSQYGFNSSQIEEMARSMLLNTSAHWLSSTHELVSTRTAFLFRPLVQSVFRQLQLPEPGKYISSSVTISIQVTKKTEPFIVYKDPTVAMVDMHKLQWPLSLRHYQTGDKFTPLGMKGKKLVSDYLTDKKKNLFEKNDQLVITDAQNRIVWLVNERIDNSYRVTESTSIVCKIELSFGNEDNITAVV